MNYDQAKLELERNHLYAKPVLDKSQKLCGLRVSVSPLMKDDGLILVKNTVGDDFKVEWDSESILITQKKKKSVRSKNI